MTRLHIFDLDGVLVNTSDIHTKALYKAVNELVGSEAANSLISSEDGIKTSDKLDLLLKTYDFDKVEVDNYKGFLTVQELYKLPKCHLINELLALKKAGNTLALASNSRRHFVDIILHVTGLGDIFDFVITGDSVKNGKPHREIFAKVIKHFKAVPTNTIIYEDSPAGLKAALSTKSFVVKVDPSRLLQPEEIV